MVGVLSLPGRRQRECVSGTIFDSNPPDKFANLDRVTIPTWLLLLGSLISAFFDWRAEQRKDK